MALNGEVETSALKNRNHGLIVWRVVLIIDRKLFPAISTISFRKLQIFVLRSIDSVFLVLSRFFLDKKLLLCACNDVVDLTQTIQCLRSFLLYNRLVNKSVNTLILNSSTEAVIYKTVYNNVSNNSTDLNFNSCRLNVRILI